MKAVITIFLLLFTSSVNGQKDTTSAPIYQNEGFVEIKHILPPFNFNILKEYSSSIIPFNGGYNNLSHRIGPGPIIGVPGPEPEMYFIINNNRIPYKPAKSPKINPKWIKRIETKTNRGEPSNNGNRYGMILFYPKKRYCQKIEQLLLNN